MAENVLVAGGAGYIGSHVVRELMRKGGNVTVVDNLSTGHRWAVPEGVLEVEDIGDAERMKAILREKNVDTVMHFAAHIVVPESVANPYKYYVNNVLKTIELLRAMAETGVRNFIFSSSAAVYGNPERVPIREDEPIKPINPYGNTKAAVERILEDFSAAHGTGFVSLRYFNAAGADPAGGLGECHDPETHLIPLLLKAARGQIPGAKIFGTDYPTPDGTCIRDYIHVNDLAEAHILALSYLAGGGKNAFFNCGYGRGYSVREVVDMAKRVTGVDFPVTEEARRPGDPPVLVADSTELAKNLAWKPEHDDLEHIVKTAWEWERNL
ncbi:MAG: UDP-glucose 4-epimerase GalE [Deltaproteobacteria bacterium]|nr:UDP-glucose 4-epimerase GalE [Deltaproteobacteria bacterium]NIS77816.1 UDP-glucose 4-epimerase GalE [Deltaproteobacteria bacterium]